MQQEASDLEHPEVLVRRLRPEDLEAVIELDRRVTGRRREEYFKLKLKQALSDTGIEVSLGAELDRRSSAFFYRGSITVSFARSSAPRYWTRWGSIPISKGAASEALSSISCRSIYSLSVSAPCTPRSVGTIPV